MDEETLDDYLFLKEIDNKDYSDVEEFPEDDLFDPPSKELQVEEIEEDDSDELFDDDIFLEEEV